MRYVILVQEDMRAPEGSQEARWSLHNDRTYDTAGVARGVIRRHLQRVFGASARVADRLVDGNGYRVLAVDLDLCEAVTKTWTVEQQASHALERAQWWTRRAVDLGKRAHVPLADTAAGDAFQVAQDAIMDGRFDDAKEVLAGSPPTEPALDASDVAVVRHALLVLARLADPVLPTAEISVTRTATRAEILRAVDVLAKLDTFDRLFDLHRRHVRVAASTVDELAAGVRDAKPR